LTYEEPAIFGEGIDENNDYETPSSKINRLRQILVIGVSFKTFSLKI
jgi:hypothetical protein